MTEQQQKFVELNHNLIYSFLQKYHLPIEDWYGWAAIGLCKAAMTFKDDVSSFSTYAYRCMFNAVMMEKRKETQAGTIPEHLIFYYQAEFDAENDGDSISFLETIPSKDDVEADALAKAILDELNKILKPRDRLVFQMFRNGYKQREISRMVGCSQPHISRIKKKLEKYLSV